MIKYISCETEDRKWLLEMGIRDKKNMFTNQFKRKLISVLPYLTMPILKISLVKSLEKNMTTVDDYIVYSLLTI